ncbi:Bug family tripartite tricarboxylate transporter substrate binding protein [Paramicrobacterium chengjingii]|uniref:Tripartite-type tricarboxylate transporter, receptor component TctC n=1 Tax=Paramicrobacterium chengjingii TaxID=2769067 RepID=A0ABX6YI27_9MICO|nr:tripartite tricarboxylate transporter substrate-binding protein [Microbacterium chengjingii]QPZ38421.1 hypothetical protein HCR76_16825 [Microbacterium chengjingii]
MTKRFTRTLAAVALGASAAMAMTACSGPSQTHSDESAGLPSSIELVVPFAAGGGTDTWARFVAPYLEKKIEGNPKIVVENQPGGESITGTNKFVTSGSTDGSQLLVTSGSTYIPALLNRSEVKYDFTKLVPVVVNGTGGAVYVSSSTGIKQASDLAGFDKTLSYGGISATGNDLVTLLAMDVLDIDIDATFGFEGRGPARLALERGEVNLDYQTTSAFVSQVQPMIDDGKATALFSFGVPEDGEIVRDPALPDLPTLEEVYENINGEAPSGEAYDAYRAFLSAGYFYQKGIWVNEGTDPAVVDALRAAAKELSTDEEFIAKSKDALGGYPLVSGDEAQEDLTKTFDVSEAVRNYTLDLLKNSYDVTVDTK